MDFIVEWRLRVVVDGPRKLRLGEIVDVSASSSASMSKVSNCDTVPCAGSKDEWNEHELVE